MATIRPRLSSNKALEIWKPVPIKEYEDIYQVSGLGGVKSLARIVVRKNGARLSIAEKILKPANHNSGYFSVNLSTKGKPKTFCIHELVALAFIGPRPKGKNGEEIRHIDNNPLNNNYKNLTYGSRKENCNDRLRADTHTYGEKNGFSKLTFEEVGKIRRLKLSDNLNNLEISKMFKISKESVWRITHNKDWAPSNYKKQILALKQEGKDKEAKRVERELNIIMPKGWL